MARYCSVCVHTERAAIDRALVGGESNRVIARQYAVSHDAVRRHRAHIPVALAKAAEAKEVAQADSLLSSIIALRERLEGSLGNAETARDVASLARELRETLRLMLELEGRLRKGAQVKVAVQANVAVAEEAGGVAAEPKGNLLEGFLRKVHDVLVQSGATEPVVGMEPAKAAHEPPALGPGTSIPEAASASEAVAAPIALDATQEALLKELRDGAKKLGASIRHHRFVYNGRPVEGKAEWDEYIDAADVRGLKFLYQNFGAALPERMVEPPAPALDRADLVSKAVSLHRKLGFARIPTRKHTIPFGEGESRKFFESYDIESLRDYVEFLESLVRARGMD